LLKERSPKTPSKRHKTNLPSHNNDSILPFKIPLEIVKPFTGSEVQGSEVQGSEVQGSEVQGSEVQGSEVQRFKVQGSEVSR
jgi:hypothetical protein